MVFILRHACLWLGFLSLLACNNADFSGAGRDSNKSNGNASANNNNNNGQNAVNSPNGTCGADGATQARLLTEKVQNGTQGNYIEYEIYLTDCAGARKSLVADSIFFDIDAASPDIGKGEALFYSIRNGEATVSGQLEEVRGSDLFGKTGDEFYHNRTDKKVAVDTLVPLILKIDLRGKLYHPRGATYANGSAYVLPTFLRVGNTSPVQKNVNFLGK